MASDSFRALVIEQPEGTFRSELRELTTADLPDGDVLVDVAFSSLNYKDGMAVTNTGRIIRNFPFVPGIDFAGTVAESSSPRFKHGDAVVLTGWGVGERHWGGYSQRARVKSDWLVGLPSGLTLEQSMAIGTAGLTTMLCVMALEEHGCQPSGRDVVVSGAAGGVGSVACAVLAKLGYGVVASSGRAELAEYLKSLGVKEIIDRSVLGTASARPMESERWGGAVDTVGGVTLASIIKQLAYGGSVAACGLAGGTDLATTVYPFILRGVNLLGVDSVACPTPRREAAWKRLASDLPADLLAAMTSVHGLADVPELSKQILAGNVRGRVVVDVNR